MSRRVVPVTFWVGALLGAVLLLADGVRASRPPVGVLGTWDGFFVEADDDAAPGLVQSAITQQVGRRIAGDGVLLDSGGLLFNTWNFSGTIASDDFLTGTGQALTGRVVLEADLETFAGGAGDAGVMSPRFLFVPVRGRASRINSILLHPFPDVDSPNLAGSGTGYLKSRIDRNFAGDLAVTFLPRDRDSFPGHVDFMPQSALDFPFSWQCRATTSNDGRFVMIARGKTGSLVANGMTLPGGAGATPDFVWGTYKLLLNDGRLDFGAYNFNLTGSLR